MPESQEKNMYIRSIVRIMDTELEKDTDNIDTALLAECDEWLKWLESDGQELSDAELTRKYECLMSRITNSADVQSSIGCRRSRSGKLKKAFVAAVAAALTLIVLTVVCFAVPGIRNRIVEIARLPGQSIVEDGNITYIKGDVVSKSCNSLDDCLKEHHFDILYPHRLPEGVTLQYVIDYTDSEQNMLLDIVWSNGMALSIQLNDHTFSSEGLTLYEIHGLCFWTMAEIGQEIKEPIYNAYLLTDDYLYTLTAKTEEDLSAMMDSFE